MDKEQDKPQEPLDPQSPWESLAEQLGATPPPDALERKRPAIPESYQPRERKPDAPKRPVGDWNKLASELGIEAPESLGASSAPTSDEATPTPAESKAAYERTEESADAEESSRPRKRSSRRPRGRRGAKKPSDEVKAADAGDDESLFANLPTIEGEGDAWTGESADDHDQERSEEPVASEELAKSAPATDSDDDALANEQAESGDVEDDSLSGDAARSAFDALFESGSFASMELKPEEETGEKQTEGDVEPAAKAEPPTEPSAAEADKSSARTSGDPGAPEFDDDSTKRRGGWFGFGKGRRKPADAPLEKPIPEPTEEAIDQPEDWLGKSATESAEMATEDESASTDEEEPAEKSGRRRRRRRRRRSGAKEEKAKSAGEDNGRIGRADDEEIEAAGDSDDVDDMEAGQSSSPRRRPMHKNIPSWADAIGVLVDLNLQGRKSRERSSSSRGGPGKGRSRGGRRRKNN